MPSDSATSAQTAHTAPPASDAARVSSLFVPGRRLQHGLRVALGGAQMQALIQRAQESGFIPDMKDPVDMPRAKCRIAEHDRFAAIAVVLRQCRIQRNIVENHALGSPSL